MDQLVNWEAIKATRNELVIAANIRENQSRVEHVYNVGDKILILHDRNEPKAKLGPPTQGPFEIRKVYDNGTVKIWRNRYGEIINSIKPYRSNEKE